MAQEQRPESLTSVAQKISNRLVLVERSVAGGCHEDMNHFKLVNETQRFELWAKNLGLYHLGHSSLDYRFRDAPSLFEYTIGLLRNLEALLVKLMNILSPGHLSNLNASDTTKAHIQSLEQFSDDSEDDFESSDDESITDLLLSGMAASIDKLYRLSFKIRNPAMRLGFSKALKYRALDTETGVDLIDQFRKSDQRHIEQLFATYRSTSARDLENDFLVRRLAKANTRRRQQFGYWKKRRARFDMMPRIEIIEEMRPDPITQEPKNSPNLNVPVVPTAPSQPSTATHLDVSKVKLDDDASMISSSTVVHMPEEANGDWFSIPPPPMHLWGREEFECPYCFTLCPRKMLHQKAWQTHILRDLRPYLCTYEDCRDADQQYDSLSDWINHETIIHQSKSRITRNEKGETSIQASRKCPFCLEDAGPHHIATHLRRVACFSLPRSVGDDEDGSLQGSQISGRAEIRTSNTQDSETRTRTSESISQADPEVTSKDNSLLTVESLYQQRADPNDEESRVNQFLERLEGDSVDSLKLEVKDIPFDHDTSEPDGSLVLTSPSSEMKKAVLYDPKPDAMAMAKALSQHRDIDAKAIIRILPSLSRDQIMDLRKEYKAHVKLQGKGINMAKHIRLKLGYSAFGLACYVTALGHFESEAFWANCYYQHGPSRRELLIESLIGQSNATILEIKKCFRESRYNDDLEKCIKAEVKPNKFQTAILIALKGQRQSERDPLDENLVQSDVTKIYHALHALEDGETAMIDIILSRSDLHLRAVLRAYEDIYKTNFARSMLAKSQNIVGETLAHILNGVINRPLRDALLLHQALRDSHTHAGRCELLTSRLVRLHWQPRHLDQVKSEFRKRYGEQLEEAIAEEILVTSGEEEYGKFCIELARSSEAMHSDLVSTPLDNTPPPPGLTGGTSLNSTDEHMVKVVNSSNSPAPES
ncbi:hypothetical protein BDV39DRAFT_204775 [Aspergillus sergii]|uniref:Oxidoreductase acuF-like C2H2 type zinc-finger domain-containing protein n=1 Tax=Aspergillus sergii TaxID=1034303 RepID=A0A5N6X3G4_9EURO|nr:hypothetical protein BDV39DRAFT_204775 [Aspergillus sergii]